jgi:hypothetical protein
VGNRDDRTPASLFSSHGLVLIAAWREPTATLEQLAEMTGLAPRYVSIVLGQLRRLGIIRRDEACGLIVNVDRPLIHPMFAGKPLAALLRAAGDLATTPGATTSAPDD